MRLWGGKHRILKRLVYKTIKRRDSDEKKRARHKHTILLHFHRSSVADRSVIPAGAERATFVNLERWVPQSASYRLCLRNEASFHMSRRPDSVAPRGIRPG